MDGADQFMVAYGVSGVLEGELLEEGRELLLSDVLCLQNWTFPCQAYREGSSSERELFAVGLASSC